MIVYKVKQGNSYLSVYICNVRMVVGTSGGAVSRYTLVIYIEFRGYSMYRTVIVDV